MRNAEMFQTFVDQADAIVGADSKKDGSIGLFHILAAACDWCDVNGVDFNATLQEVRDQIAAEVG